MSLFKSIKRWIYPIRYRLSSLPYYRTNAKYGVPFDEDHDPVPHQLIDSVIPKILTDYVEFDLALDYLMRRETSELLADGDFRGAFISFMAKNFGIRWWKSPRHGLEYLREFIGYELRDSFAEQMSQHQVLLRIYVWWKIERPARINSWTRSGAEALYRELDMVFGHVGFGTPQHTAKKKILNLPGNRHKIDDHNKINTVYEQQDKEMVELAFNHRNIFWD